MQDFSILALGGPQQPHLAWELILLLLKDPMFLVCRGLLSMHLLLIGTGLALTASRNSGQEQLSFGLFGSTPTKVNATTFHSNYQYPPFAISLPFDTSQASYLHFTLSYLTFFRPITTTLSNLRGTK